MSCIVIEEGQHVNLILFQSPRTTAVYNGRTINFVQFNNHLYLCSLSSVSELFFFFFECQWGKWMMVKCLLILMMQEHSFSFCKALRYQLQNITNYTQWLICLRNMMWNFDLWVRAVHQNPSHDLGYCNGCTVVQFRMFYSKSRNILPIYINHS